MFRFPPAERLWWFETKILAASIRTVNHVKEAASAGAHVATIPAPIIKGLAGHALTEKGLDQFSADWAATSKVLFGFSLLPSS